MRAILLCCFVLLGSCATTRAPVETDAPKPVSPWVENLRPTTDRIIQYARTKNRGYERLEQLCDGIGHRLSGSKSLNKAIEWALHVLRDDKQENVHSEPVMVPRWTRGKESLEMLKPRREPLVMLGLGGSVGTRRSGLKAQVVVVHNEEELEQLGTGVKGKIVLFNNPMPKYDPATGSGYGHTVRFRVHGPSMAAKYGAKGILVRSVTAHSLRSPHTGATRYAKDVKQIPAAAITTEDAEMIDRLIASGEKVVVRLKMEARNRGKVPSANVVAELKGRELPDEIVVIGAHIDSWDVGQGAHDDATGVVMAMESLRILREMNLRPRRTIRVVLWTNEENGLAGGRAYANDHSTQLDKHVAAIESDSGGFQPVGYSIELENKAREAVAAETLKELLPLFKSIGPMTIKQGFSGADIRPMKQYNVPLMGFRVDGKDYFDYHHSHADTLDKVDPTEFSNCIASMATMAYVLAEMPGRLTQTGVR